MKTRQTHTYQLISLMSLSTYVTIDGEQCSIAFKGGFLQPFRSNGTYTTTDPKVIKALESDVSYNNKYKKIFPLVDEQDIDEQVTEQPKPAATPTTTNSKLESVPGISSGQKARAYLLARFEDVTNADLRTNEAMLTIATEKGLKFPDWTI